MLSNIPTWHLIITNNQFDNCLGLSDREYNEYRLNDEELESRAPNEASYYFGDCAGEPIFIPIEPEYDDDGNPVFEEMIGYDDDGDEVWN